MCDFGLVLIIQREEEAEAYHRVDQVEKVAQKNAAETKGGFQMKS